jgi:hypothetical protein
MAERGKKPGKHRAFDETYVTKIAAMVIGGSPCPNACRPRMVNKTLTRPPNLLTMIKNLLTGSVFIEMPSG